MKDMEYIEIPLRGTRGKGKFVLVDGDYFSQFHWRIQQNGYVFRTLYPPTRNISYLAREVARPPKGMWVTYLDGNRLNCRSYNLRWITPAQAAAHRPMMRTKPGVITYRGVNRSSWNWDNTKRYGDTYVVYCAKKYIGTFRDPLTAALAYDKAAKKNWGDRARLNFP